VDYVVEVLLDTLAQMAVGRRSAGKAARA
jgi:hypothetical protein